MGVIYYCTAVMVCLNLGNSLGSTRDRSYSEERLTFFDAELFQVLNEKPTGNLLVSPIGVKLLLGMIMEGAEGGSAEELRAALRFPHDAEARRKEFNTWLPTLQVNEAWSILKMTNRVFMSDRCIPGSNYENTLEKYYSAGITRVNFQNSREAARTINDWVGQQTSQLIPAMVEEGQIHAEHKLFVASAVYFKGLWSQPFASDRTTLRCFYSGDSVCRDALMMSQTGSFNYGYIARLEAKAIALPYKGGKFSMLLLLPSKRESAESLARDLVHVSLNSILSEMTEQEVLVQIPTFEIAYNENLMESFKKLGISQVFGHDANLTKMFENHLETTSISSIYHLAKITVNEEGSEAAAATGAMFVPLMGGTTTSFVANRPFLFFVINSVNNYVLFAGKVVSPLTSQSSKKITPLLYPNKISRSQKPPQERPPTPLLFRTNDHFRNASEESTKAIGSLEKFHQRGQSMGPRFRSIKPLFSIPQGPPPSTNEREFNASSRSKFIDSIKHETIRHPSLRSDKTKEIQNCNGAIVAFEKSGNQKRQKPPSDDSRRHYLFFS